MNYKHTEIEENNSSWLITYGDLMTLMLTFFVLLYSMSEINPVKISSIIEKEEGSQHFLNMYEIKQALEEIIETTNLEESAKISYDKRGVSLELKGDVSFSSGSAKIKPRLDVFIGEFILKLLNNPKDNRTIIIEGHSDNQKISQNLIAKYPTNWELSSARSSSVVNRIIEKSKDLAEQKKIREEYVDGRISGRLIAAGYADQWPAKISLEERKKGGINTEIIKENNKTNKLKEKNRRIKIIYCIN